MAWDLHYWKLWSFWASTNAAAYTNSQSIIVRVHKQMGDKFKWKQKPLKQTVKTSNGIFMGTQRKWKKHLFSTANVSLLVVACALALCLQGPQTGPKSPNLKPGGLLEVNRFILYFPFSGVDFGIGNTGLSSPHHSPFPTTFLLSCSPFPHSLFILHFFPQGNVRAFF